MSRKIIKVKLKNLKKGERKMKEITKKYFSEEAVKNKLGIDSFSNLPKDTMKLLASMIPYIDKDVMTEIINQFPSIVDFGKTAISVYDRMCNNILEKKHESHMETIQGYKITLETLSKMMDAESITEDLQKDIIEKMLFVAEKIAEENLLYRKDLEDQHNRWGEVVKYFCLGFCIVLCSAIFSGGKKR